MRAILAMFVFVTGLLVLTTAVYTRDLQRFLRPRAVFLKHRIKDSCGFKPSLMSTAYGFGKRGVLKSSEYREEITPEEALRSLWDKLQRNLPENERLAERVMIEMARANADNKRTQKKLEQQDEGNEEQPMVVDLP